MKFKWDQMSDEEPKREKEAWEIAIESVISDEQLAECEEFEKLAEAKKRMIFDSEEKWVNMANRRVTDIKGNSRVISPPPNLKVWRWNQNWRF